MWSCCLSEPGWKTILTIHYFKLLFSQFKVVLYILTNGLIFKTDCEFQRSRRFPGKRVPYFTRTKLSIHRNVWSYPRNISSSTSERSDIHEITVWVGFTLLLLNLARYICFPLWKWLKVESSGSDLTVGATWCRLMCEGCGEGFVCMCVCVCDCSRALFWRGEGKRNLCLWELLPDVL